MKKRGINELQNDKVLFVLGSALFVLTLVYVFTTYTVGFNSDSAAANLLAREQMRTGQLFPKTWNHSTGIFIVFYNLLMIPLSLLIKDQLILRSVAVAIVLAVFVLLLRYYSRSAFNSNFYLVMLCFFFSGTSAMVIDMAFAQAAYLISLLDNLIVLVLLTKAFDDGLKIRNKKWFALLLLDVAYLGIYGTLNLAYQILPLLGAMGLYLILEYGKEPYAPIKADAFRWVKILLAITAASAAGLAVDAGLRNYTGFISSTDAVAYPDISSLADSFLSFVLSGLGYMQDVRVFTLAGVMNAIIVFAFIGAVVCCILLFKKYHEQPFAMKLLMNFSLSIFAIFFYFDFTIYSYNTDLHRYFFKPLIFLWILAAYYIYTYVMSKGFLIKIAALSIVGMFSLPYMLAGIPQLIQYPELHTEQLALMSYLQEHGLKHGYATFWNAGSNTVLSNFDIEIGGVFFSNPITPFYWLSSTMSYDPEKYTGDTFLLLTETENDLFSHSVGLKRLGEPKDVLFFEDYIIYVFPYNVAEDNFGGRLQDVELIDGMIVSNDEMRDEEGNLHLESGEVIFGPYMSLESSPYRIDLEFSELEEDVSLRLTTGGGANVIYEEILRDKKATVFFSTDEEIDNFEIVLTTNKSAVLSSIKITKTEEFIRDMRVSNERMRDKEGQLHLKNGETIFGPYITLESGSYRIALEFSELEGDVLLRLTTDRGDNTIHEEILRDKKATVSFIAGKKINDFEVVLTADRSAILSSVKITKNGEFIPEMSVSNDEMRDEEGTLHLKSGETVFGPYLSLEPGSYQIELEFSELEEDVLLRLTTDKGENTIHEEILQDKETVISFETAEKIEDFEVVLTTDQSVVLSSIKIIKTENN